MFRNFNAACLGVSGRQSELIELAMSYGFKGMDLDMVSFANQAQTRGLEHANRYLDSAGLKVGTWNLPVRLCGEEAAFREDLLKLKQSAEIAGQIGALQCTTFVMAASDTVPFQENFEFHQKRLQAIAEILEPHHVRLGLEFHPTAAHRKDKQFEFISSVEQLLPLIDIVGSPSIGVGLDTWAWHVGGGTMDQVKSLGPDKIVSVKIADVPAGDTSTLTDEQRLMPGESGVTPARELIALLEEIEFSGPVTPFPDPSQFPRASRDKTAARVCEALKSVWEELIPDEESDEAETAETSEVEESTAAAPTA